MTDVLVLCYHAVSTTWPADLSVHPDAFARQLAALRRAGYHGTTFTEAVTAPPAARTVAVTFDDGYRSVLALGAPALREVGWPATVFAPTDHVASDGPMCWPGIDQWLGTEHESELLPLSWDEFRGLADEGWEVGSHTCSHARLTEIDDEALADELDRSRAQVTRHMGAECTSIAYPYGDCDSRVVAAAGVAGYTAAGSLPSGGWHDERVLEWPRVGVWHRDGVARVAAKAAPPARWLRRRLGR